MNHRYKLEVERICLDEQKEWLELISIFNFLKLDTSVLVETYNSLVKGNNQHIKYINAKIWNSNN